MKYLVVIGDGMADGPVEELCGKTPLGAAFHPVMDSMASRGEMGLVRTVPNGLPPGSDTAILSIFGYPPRRYYSGRAPLEAAAAGVELGAGQAAYRCNLVSLDGGQDAAFSDKIIASHSGGAIDGSSALLLMDCLLAHAAFSKCAAAYGMRFYPAASFRHLAVQKGADITGLVCAEPHQRLGKRVGDNLPRCAPLNPLAGELARMMELAHEVLDAHPINAARRADGKLPANGIWFWAQGMATALPPFWELHKKSGVVIGAVPLVLGIAALAGLQTVTPPGATGELNTCFEAKADAAIAAVEGGADLALVHVEAPDECTHNGDLRGKLQAVEWLDQRLLARLAEAMNRAGEPWRLLLLSDHETLTSTRGHGGAPVPYLIFDSRSEKAAPATVRRYTEKEARGGPYIEEGHSLISRFLEEG